MENKNKEYKDFKKHFGEVAKEKKSCKDYIKKW